MASNTIYAPAPEAKLDRRRAKARAAAAKAESAQQRISDLDTQLADNATRTHDDEAALRRARDEVARLKKSLTSAAKRKQRLEKARSKAARRPARPAAGPSPPRTAMTARCWPTWCAGNGTTICAPTRTSRSSRCRAR